MVGSGQAKSCPDEVARSVMTNVWLSYSAVGVTTVTVRSQGLREDTVPHFEGPSPRLLQPGHVPTLMGVRRISPPMFHSRFRVSPGTKELSICTFHQAEAWKWCLLASSTAPVSVTVMVWSDEYLAYATMVSSLAFISTGMKDPSVPSSFGTVKTIESPSQ